ncbi:MAG TPA: S4 domain-containing protein [Bacilli bacterium]|nr:S4 domain-containing protein [Bacilli bacterium]
MRIDKYLKLTRIIKRRQVSKEIIEYGRVAINGKVVKPASNVKVGDKLSINFSKVLVEVEVLQVDEKIVKFSPDQAYKILSEKANEN